MDIHRARFVPYPTSAINALAFSHSNSAEIATDSTSNLRLAVGRANGDIEIWNPFGQVWVQEIVFHGGRNRSIEGLIWTQEPTEKSAEGKLVAGALRLFSIGYSSTVTEWNLVSGLPQRHWSGNESEVWCFAAQPRLVISSKDPPKQNPTGWTGQNIVAGCSDGSLVVLSTADNDLTFQRFLARTAARYARVLSLTFQNRSTLIAGFANSTIRIFDLRQGTLVRNISLGAAPRGGPKEILVWSVKCLANGDVVSGDSLGEIRIFERKHWSQVQRLASHDADILDLAVSKETNSIFSTGMDRRTSSYASRSSDTRWIKNSHETYHEHDVKVMSTFEGKKLNIIASGGLYSSSDKQRMSNSLRSGYESRCDTNAITQERISIYHFRSPANPANRQRNAQVVLYLLVGERSQHLEDEQIKEAKETSFNGSHSFEGRREHQLCFNRFFRGTISGCDCS
jgi:U3 small nucleolar RNA-associated protein 4